MGDDLPRRIEQQIRDRLLAEHHDTENRIAEQFRQQGRHDRADETVRMSIMARAQRIEEEVARTLPFALEVAGRDVVTNHLSEDQYDEAGIMAAKSALQETLQTFERRVQNSPGMSSERHQFSEQFLGMAKTHTQMMFERLADVKHLTEEDLEETARVIADDLRTLSDRDRY